MDEHTTLVKCASRAIEAVAFDTSVAVKRNIESLESLEEEIAVLKDALQVE